MQKSQLSFERTLYLEQPVLSMVDFHVMLNKYA